jgi:ABC-2 type transport system ATP-binding protein
MRSPSDDRPAILCRGVRKTYGSVVAVAHIDLEIRRGECYGLLGPNGAGKTTTVEIIEGLTAPDAGVVEVLGARWGDDDRRLRSRLGIQLQETQLTEKQTVEEALRLFRSFYERGPTVAELLAHVQLWEKRRAYVRDLSGGQRQRLSVACALAGDPEILFLDEPTTGLDPQSRRAVWDVCEEFRAGGGTILLTTHFMDEAERLADRVAIMDHGRLLVEGSPRELIDTLGGAYVIEFETAAQVDVAALAALQGVRRAEVEASGTRWHITADVLHEVVPALIAYLAGKGGGLAALTTHRATLDDVFLARTGRQLRDE